MFVKFAKNMKVCLLLLTVLVVLAAGTPINEKKGSQWVYIPDYDGNFYWADLNTMPTKDERFDPFKDISLHVYTRKNPSVAQPVLNGNINELANTNLDLKKPVKFVIHGWINKAKSEVNRAINNAFQTAMDVNVIVVDWSAGASTILYPAAAAKVSGVGMFVASVIDWMVARGASLNNVHIIGHSLGGHASGHAGRHVKSGKVAYITAMDPAKPLFENIPINDGININDGNYVEIIHTDTNSYGMKEARGHTDFYPNGGKSQPGCITNTCDHLRAFHFMADSIDHDLFRSRKCDDLSQAEKENCSGANLHMGGARTKQATGIYHLKTNNKEPYYLG